MPAKPTMRSSMAMDQPAKIDVKNAGADYAATEIVNAISVDVEESFQVSAFASTIDEGDWEAYESRVEYCVDRLLDLFAAHDARCTFFTLGWVAERHKSMIRKIVDGGHELASHGKIGDVRLAQADLSGALEAYREVGEVFRRLGEADPSNAGGQRDLSLSLMRLAFVSEQSGDRVEALPPAEVIVQR